MKLEIEVSRNGLAFIGQAEDGEFLPMYILSKMIEQGKNLPGAVWLRFDREGHFLRRIEI
jgi:hypothetical protein